MGPMKNKIKDECKRNLRNQKMLGAEILLRPLWISWCLKSHPITRFLSIYRKSLQQRWKQTIFSREIMVILKAHQQNWIYRWKNCDKSTCGSKRNGQIRQIARKMVQYLIQRRNLIGTNFKSSFCRNAQTIELSV